MKKFAFFIFAICFLSSPIFLSAQKRTTAQRVTPAKPIVLKNNVDSVSYALGASIAQSGLKNYLIQMGVLADTVAVNTDYSSKIDNETDATKKNKLTNELKFKIDSINKANKQNMDQFMLGFNQTINQDKNKSSFNAGVAIASQLSTATERFEGDVLGDGGKLNMAAFTAAFMSSLKDEDLLIKDANQIVENAATQAQQIKEEKQAEGLKSQYAEQIAAGDKFMAENKEKAGVVVLPDGLQYKVVTMGTGEVPTANDRVKVHYHGTLIDGTVFDSSVDRGEPITFGVSQVIKGWTEALQMMPVGSKWILYIPYDLAYGSRDQGAIKPFSNLIFEVELLEIEK